MQTISTSRQLVKEAWASADKWQGNYAAAEQLLREAATKQQANTLVLTCLGAVLCDQAKYKEAADVLASAAKLGSNDRNTYFNLGVALLNVATHEEAMTAFSKAKQLVADGASWEAYFDPQAQ
jgi:Flp pilus assembly protein TadD